MNNATPLPAGYATMLRNLDRELLSAELHASNTGRLADAKRVVGIRGEIIRVRQGEL